MARSNVAMDGTSRSNSSEHCPPQKKLTCYESMAILETLGLRALGSQDWYCAPLPKVTSDGALEVSFPHVLGTKKGIFTKMTLWFSKAFETNWGAQVSSASQAGGLQERTLTLQSTGVIWGQRKWKLVQNTQPSANRNGFSLCTAVMAWCWKGFCILMKVFLI